MECRFLDIIGWSPNTKTSWAHLTKLLLFNSVSGPISGIKWIQTPYRFFINFGEDKSLVRRKSSGLSPSSIPAAHLAMTPKYYCRSQWKVLTQNQKNSSTPLNVTCLFQLFIRRNAAKVVVKHCWSWLKIKLKSKSMAPLWPSSLGGSLGSVLLGSDGQANTQGDWGHFQLWGSYYRQQPAATLQGPTSCHSAGTGCHSSSDRLPLFKSDRLPLFRLAILT